MSDYINNLIHRVTSRSEPTLLPLRDPGSILPLITSAQDSGDNELRTLNNYDDTRVQQPRNTDIRTEPSDLNHIQSHDGNYFRVKDPSKDVSRKKNIPEDTTADPSNPERLPAGYQPKIVSHTNADDESDNVLQLTDIQDGKPQLRNSKAQGIEPPADIRNFKKGSLRIFVENDTSKQKNGGKIRPLDEDIESRRMDRHTMQTTTPTVRVSIGKIEVRAVLPPLNSPKPVKPARPKMSLDDYLRRREGGNQ
jgi:hypothetical protein